MAVDTPARIAILGAGPVGLEAALYARYLGYDVDLYERGRVAENMLRWGHVRLFTPWGMNVSSLGMAALRAQDDSWRPPPHEALLTGREMVDAYYLPLARSDLLADTLRAENEVVAVGRQGQLKGEHVGDDARIFADFRILLRDSAGRERVETADVVIDASGTYGNHCWIGDGGIPAVGELASARDIEYGLPDVLGNERQWYAGRRTLVIGSGYCAATSMVSLAALATESRETRVFWTTRHEPHDGGPGKVLQVSDDPLAERERLAAAANELASSGQIDYLPGTWVEAVERTSEGSFRLQLVGKHAGQLEVDRIVANVGYRPDNTLWAELQVHECYATGGPLPMAKALLEPPLPDRQDLAIVGPQALINPEPDFYVLGAKSYGRDSRFLLATGLVQIRNLFSIIGDRAELDLYAQYPNGPRSAPPM